MKNLLKKLSCMVLIVGVVIGCCACSTNSSKAYTFKVDTGDQVKVELNTADRYDITSDLPFVISKDNKTLSQGTFITADDYDSYVSVVNDTDTATVIDKGDNETYEYIMWNNNDEEYDYAIHLKDSKTGILIGNNVSEKSAKECFSRLTFSIVK